MNESQLRSAISNLQRECSQLARENNIMRSEINAICNSARSATYSLTRSCDSASNVLENSANIIEYSDHTLQEITAEQEHIEVLYRGFKNIETANKKIRELNNKIYFEFANFRMVRKIVGAFIDNINLEMVSTDFIYKSVEKEHLQSPDFWLSCSMLAIMHWKNDDQKSAQIALEQAMNLDDRQTTLFFMSFNLLFGRKEAALKWFNYYRTIEKTGDDAGFILLLLHATNLNEESNDAFTKCIKSYLIEEFDKSASMNDFDEMVELVKDYLIQCNSKDTFVFDTLRNYLKDYSTILDVLSMAKDNTAIIEFIERNNCSTRDKGYIYIERFISELLNVPDKKERAYTDEIAYNETIIKCVGNLAEAEEEFKRKQQHDVSPLNLMRECVGWLFGGHSSEFSELARYNMFILYKDLIKKAVGKYLMEYRSRHKMIHPATIKDYNTEMNFNNKTDELNKVEHFYKQKSDSQLTTIKNTSFYMCIIFAVICFIGGFVALVIDNMSGRNFWIGIIGLMFVLTVVLTLSAVGYYFGNKKKRKSILVSTNEAINSTKKIVENLFDEYAQYLAIYDENDRMADDIMFAINR